MKSMAVRAALLCLFVGASGVAVYVLWTGESLARRDEDSASRFANAALAVEHNVMELRAAQQAYVAAGQGDTGSARLPRRRTRCEPELIRCALRRHRLRRNPASTTRQVR